MTAPRSRFREPKVLDAGCLQPEISSFWLHLAAEGKAARTVRTYTEAVQWFAAAQLHMEPRCMGWEEIRKQDVQGWIAWLLGQYSAAYASNQFRALQQFFKWLAAEDEIPDPMASYHRRDLRTVRHLSHVDRHLPHDTTRNARFLIGIVSAAKMGILSAGQHLPRARGWAVCRAAV